MKSKKIINLEEYKPVKTNSRGVGNKNLLKEKISRATKAIRRKYLALKMGKADEDETLNRLLNPIIEPLRDIKIGIPMISSSTVKEENVKHEIDKKNVKSQKPPVEFLEDEVVGEVFSEADPEEYVEQSTDDIHEEYNNLLRYNKPVIDQYLEQFPPLSRYYIEGFFTDRESYDETFGARFDFKTNKLSIGNKTLHIGANNELIVGDRPYEGTKGLYELIFLKQPHRYSEKDLNNYKEILEYTSAHRRNYEPQGQIKGNRYHKYAGIIKPLIARTKSQSDMGSSVSSPTSAQGRRASYSAAAAVAAEPPHTALPRPAPPSQGSARLAPRAAPPSQGPPRRGAGAMMMTYNEKPIEYIYWDDVNELVDRLRLLVASKSAGNTDSHDNEILAIISELKEIEVIS